MPFFNEHYAHSLQSLHILYLHTPRTRTPFLPPFCPPYTHVHTHIGEGASGRKKGGLIENDSSAKRMRAQQPGENASCASAGRNSESDQTVGFSDTHLLSHPSPPPSLPHSLSFFLSMIFSLFVASSFFFSRRDTRNDRAFAKSSIQSVASGAESNEATQRNVKFSVTSAVRELHVDPV